MTRRIGATSSTAINPSNYSEDPEYAYHSLSWHAARFEDDRRREQSAAAKVERAGRFVPIEAAA